MAHPRLVRVDLFGSRAKGTERPYSDVDLALWGVDEMEAGRIALELDELPLPLIFNVITMSSIDSQPLAAHIARVGKTLYQAKQ